MVDRTPHRITKPLTPESARRYEAVRSEIDTARSLVQNDLDELKAAATRARMRRGAALQPLRDAALQLKASREEAGLSLEEMKSRTGLLLEEITRLEQGEGIGQNFALLSLYANALGKSLNIQISDEPSATKSP